MTFRVNFLIECVSSVTWTMMNLGFYLLIFQHTTSIGAGTGWGKWEFFAFLATTMLVNSLVQAFFMPNCEDISELIRTGGLDFALLKPIDTQFLISLRKGRLVEPGQLRGRAGAARRQPGADDDAGRESAGAAAGDDRCSMCSTCSAAWRFSIA